MSHDEKTCVNCVGTVAPSADARSNEATSERDEDQHTQMARKAFEATAGLDDEDIVRVLGGFFRAHASYEKQRPSDDPLRAALETIRDSVSSRSDVHRICVEALGGGALSAASEQHLATVSGAQQDFDRAALWLLDHQTASFDEDRASLAKQFAAVREDASNEAYWQDLWEAARNMRREFPASRPWTAEETALARALDATDTRGRRRERATHATVKCSRCDGSGVCEADAGWCSECRGKGVETCENGHPIAKGAKSCDHDCGGT